MEFSLSVFMNRSSFGVVLLTGVFSMVAQAGIPNGFEDLFSPHTQAIDIEIAGGQHAVTVLASVTYDTFRLDSEHSDLIKRYLLDSYVEASMIDTILDDLNHGVGTDADCHSNTRLCVVPANIGQAKYVFDYDEAVLRLFISPSDIVQTRTGEQTYHTSFNPHSSVINSIQLTGYSDLDQQHRTTIDNQTLLGVGFGSLFFDTQYDGDKQQFATYSAVYDLSVAGYQMKLGQHRYNLELNSLDFLHRNANYSGVSMAFGSSKSLMVGGKSANRHLSFYAPQTGLLQLYRDDRLFRSFPVEPGLQHVSYADLPSGTYALTMKLWVSGQEVFSEQRNIVNGGDYVLNPGEYDVRFDAGWLDKEWFTSYTSLGSSVPYASAGVSRLIKDPWLLAGSVSFSSHGSAVQLGTKWTVADSLSLDYSVSWSELGERYEQANISWGSLFVNGLRNQSEWLSQPSLMSVLYGLNDYQELNGGWAGSLLSGQSFVRFYRRQQQNDYTASMSTQGGISVGWSKSYQRHSIDMSMDVAQYPETEVGFRLTWRVQFSERLSAFALAFGQDGEVTNGKLGANHHVSGEQWQVSNEVTWQRNLASNAPTSWDTSNTINLETDSLRGNGYLYYSNNGQKNLSGSLNSTLLVNQHGASVTSQKSDAYMRIHSSTDARVDAYLLDESDRSLYQPIQEGATNLPLNSYQTARLQLDGSGSNTLIVDNAHSEFLHKGAVWDIELDVVPLVSQLIIVEHSPLSPVTCSVEQCRIEPVTDDGVFRVNVPQQHLEQFLILSAGNLCQMTSSTENSRIKTFICDERNE